MKKIRSRLSPLLFALAVLAFGPRAQAQGFTVTITVDEFGVMRFQQSDGVDRFFRGALAPDPGPGGLAAALTYSLLDPPGLVAGMLLGWSPLASVLLGGVTYISSSGVIAKVLGELGG